MNTDKRTGAIIDVKVESPLTVPDPKSVSRIDKVAGKNPRAVNLRDHKELSGMDLYVLDAKFGVGSASDGKATNYVVIAGFVTAPGKKPTEEDAIVIITGADNVYARVAQAYANNAFPVLGTLRNSGRAWFLD